MFKLFFSRAVYGHTHGELPWALCDEYIVDKMATIVGIMKTRTTTVCRNSNHPWFTGNCYDSSKLFYPSPVLPQIRM